MDIQNLVAIDVHTHAEVSQRTPDDPLWREIQEASKDYAKTCEEMKYEHANTGGNHWGWPSRVTALAAAGQGGD